MRVEELSQPDLPAHSRDDPQVIQALRVIGNVRRRLLHRYPPSRGDTHSTKNPEDTSTKLRNVGYLYAALEPTSGENFCMYLPGMDEGCLELFLEELSKRCPDHHLL